MYITDFFAIPEIEDFMAPAECRRPGKDPHRAPARWVRNPGHDWAFVPSMKTDIKENDGNFELFMDLPGVKKEDISVKLVKDTLTVSVSGKDEKEEKDENGKYLRRERFSGSVERSFTVGDGIDTAGIKASYENGTLKLSLPKLSESVEENHLIEIE